jgi:hypothetical protein
MEQKSVPHPLGLRQLRTSSWPFSQRRLRAAVRNEAFPAAPEALRQSEQWHCAIGLTRPSISNWTPPHRQLPRSMLFLLPA